MASKNGTGYHPPERTAVLQFEDGEHDGLVVKALLDVPMGALLKLQELQDGADASASREAMEAFAEFLIEWNVLDRNGKPVPASAEGVLSQSPLFVKDIIQAWVRAATNGPLVEPVTS